MPSPRRQGITNDLKHISGNSAQPDGGQAFSVIDKWFKGQQTIDVNQNLGGESSRGLSHFIATSKLEQGQVHQHPWHMTEPVPLMSAMPGNAGSTSPSPSDHSPQKIWDRTSANDVVRSVHWISELLLEERALAQERMQTLNEAVAKNMEMYCGEMRTQFLERGNEQAELLSRHRGDVSVILDEKLGQTLKLLQQELRSLRLSNSQNFQRVFDTLGQPQMAANAGSFLSMMQDAPASPNMSTMSPSASPQGKAPLTPAVFPTSDLVRIPSPAQLGLEDAIEESTSPSRKGDFQPERTEITNITNGTPNKRESGSSVVGNLFGLATEKQMLAEHLLKMRQAKNKSSGMEIFNKLKVMAGFHLEHVHTKGLIDPAELNRLVKFVDGTLFSTVSIVVIVLNAWWIGFVTDRDMRNRMKEPPEDTPRVYHNISTIFSIYFLLELLFRMVALRRLFYIRSDRNWNFFDTVIVFFAVVEELIASFNISFLRVLRVLRLFRVIRVLRVLRFFAGLQQMIATVLASLEHLLWSMVCIAFLMYLFAVLLLQSASSFLDEDNQHSWQVLNKNYGSVAKTMYALLAAISNGSPWVIYAEELAEVSWILRPVFGVFVVIVVFGYLNVVTGVFVNKAIDVFHQDGSIAIQREIDQTNAFVRDLASFLSDYENVPSDYPISETQLEKLLNNIEVQMLLQTHSIDVHAARELYKIIGHHGATGPVTIEHFVFGCQRMKGPAKAMDVILLFEEIVNIRNTVHENRDRQTALNREMKAWQDKCVGMFGRMCACLELELDKVVHGTQMVASR